MDKQRNKKTVNKLSTGMRRLETKEKGVAIYEFDDESEEEESSDDDKGRNRGARMPQQTHNDKLMKNTQKVSATKQGANQPTATRASPAPAGTRAAKKPTGRVANQAPARRVVNKPTKTQANQRTKAEASQDKGKPAPAIPYDGPEGARCDDDGETEDESSEDDSPKNKRMPVKKIKKITAAK